ncbi:hypothetical protein BDP81DRAFT_443702 [Colletotrichum phormii]|uniref:DUF7587 domain-containing protein n=1 Tax=Colletotrichum phormii TaxID=359342 RepID=A0AAI9ZBC9_9PEZI|nr:uncharacterized protein BDP81DRAFT_443702 [Colletotrichum phormii]KAK1613522.1 hypothetical protein BDP81DRAFT_443702 [Colletotrichum phormii]
MEQLRETFRPHRFGTNEHYMDLFHVYDDLSRTPYLHGIGIQCEDPDTYVINSWHVITPSAMRNHLNWRSSTPSQFISFFDSLQDARREQQRRRDKTYVSHVGYRRPESVRIAHVRLQRNTNVWVFSRAEMLRMMRTFGRQAELEMAQSSALGEWFVWGVVPDECVQSM